MNKYDKELKTAESAAYLAAESAAYSAARSAAYSAAESARSAARSAELEYQINKVLEVLDDC